MRLAEVYNNQHMWGSMSKVKLQEGVIYFYVLSITVAVKSLISKKDWARKKIHAQIQLKQSSARPK